MCSPSHSLCRVHSLRTHRAGLNCQTKGKQEVAKGRSRDRIFTTEGTAHAKALWGPEKDRDGQCGGRAWMLSGLLSEAGEAGRAWSKAVIPRATESP